MSRYLPDLPNTSVQCVRARPPGAGRLEYKFVVPKSQTDELREALKPWVFHDAFCAASAEKQYTDIVAVVPVPPVLFWNLPERI